MKVIAVTTAPLSTLSIDEAVNVRKANRGAEPIFIGTIRRSGVKQELIVRQNGKGHKIADGGKRFEALIWLRDHEETSAGIPVTGAFPVPIKIVECSDEEARELSLITNIARSDTHPVDRYERFAQLIEDGAKPEEVIAAYGLKQREFDQAMALGVLHPKILAAWRAGEIRAEVAQTFTLVTDKKLQEKVFDKASKGKFLHSRSDIRAEFKADEQESGYLLTFVGREKYEDRGGKVTAFDLFEGRHVVSDEELLQTMAKERLASECALLLAAGWGWAASKDELPSNWSWNWSRLNPKIEYTPEEKAKLEQLNGIIDDDEIDYREQEPAEAEIEQIEAAARMRAFGAKQMKKSGCVVKITSNGELDVEYGVVKPDNVKGGAGVVESEEFEEKRKERVKEKKATPSTALSNALVERLSDQLTTAAAAAIAKRNDIALDITIAAVLANGTEFGPGVKISHSGKTSHKARGSLKSHLETISKLTVPKKLDVLAGALGMTFDFQCRDDATFARFRAAGLCDLFGSELYEAIKEVFDAEDYFNSVNKALCLAAITEAVNADEARKISGKPKSEIAKFAITNVPKTGWLPKELRSASYGGPAAKAAKTAKAPKKAAKKKAA